MSVATLIAAINALVNEEKSNMKAARARAVVHGVKEIGDRLAVIEKRLDALENRK